MVFGLGARLAPLTHFSFIATCSHVLDESSRDNNVYALSFSWQAAPTTTMVKMRWSSSVRCCRDVQSSTIVLSVAMCASMDLAPSALLASSCTDPASTG